MFRNSQFDALGGFEVEMRPRAHDWEVGAYAQGVVVTHHSRIQGHGRHGGQGRLDAAACGDGGRRGSSGDEGSAGGRNVHLVIGIMCELPCNRIAADEIWSFRGSKSKKRKQQGHGDI